MIVPACCAACLCLSSCFVGPLRPAWFLSCPCTCGLPTLHVRPSLQTRFDPGRRHVSLVLTAVRPHVLCVPATSTSLPCIALYCPVPHVLQSLAWQRPASARPTCAPTACTTRPAAWCSWASAALMKRPENPPPPLSCAACGRRPQRVPQTSPSCCRSRCSQQVAAAGGTGATTGACTVWRGMGVGVRVARV